jgi:hypothetical protein
MPKHKTALYIEFYLYGSFTDEIKLDGANMEKQCNLFSYTDFKNPNKKLRKKIWKGCRQRSFFLLERNNISIVAGTEVTNRFY